MIDFLLKWKIHIKHLEDGIDSVDLFANKNIHIEIELDKFVIELMKIAHNETALSLALKIKSNKIDRHDKKLKHFKSLYFARQITLEQFDILCSEVEQDMRATFELAS